MEPVLFKSLRFKGISGSVAKFSALVSGNNICVRQEKRTKKPEFVSKVQMQQW